MRISKIMMITVPLLMTGCTDFFDDEDILEPQVSVPQPSQVQEPEKMPAVVAPEPAADWVPLEGQLLRAGELVMDLKKKNGGKKPTLAEAMTYLQAQMNLTAQQVTLILDELGIEL